MLIFRQNAHSSVFCVIPAGNFLAFSRSMNSKTDMLPDSAMRGDLAGLHWFDFMTTTDFD
jgi:hypothetical protein